MHHRMLVGGCLWSVEFSELSIGFEVLSWRALLVGGAGARGITQQWKTSLAFCRSLGSML